MRGFAGTAGNVVINGARPSTKAETLDTTLSRIPAQRVIRVEVGPGDLYGSDYAGKSQVLNVILSQEAGIDANVTAAARRWSTGYVNTDIQGSALIRRGPSTINLSAGTGRNRQLEEGTDTSTDVADRRAGRVPAQAQQLFQQGPVRRRKLGARARLRQRRSASTAGGSRAASTCSRRNRVTPTGAPEHDDNLIQHYRDPVIELGGDVTRPLAGGAIKFVALATRRKRARLRPLHPARRTARRRRHGQRRFRADRRRATQRDHRPAELDPVEPARLVVRGGRRGRLQHARRPGRSVRHRRARREGRAIDLPIANATVKEKRGEIYVNVGKNLSPTLRARRRHQLRILEPQGHAATPRPTGRSKFLKPNLTLDWKPGGGWHTQFSVRRTVAQLNFYDFISVGDLSARARQRRQRRSASRSEHGNSARPSSIRCFGDGLFKLDVGSDLISKLQDQILIVDDKGNVFSGPGNLGTGKRYFASLTLDAPLGRLWSGLRAKFTGTCSERASTTRSAASRATSAVSFPIGSGTSTVRRDAGALSYGFELNDNAALHLLPHRRVRHELQRRALRDRVRRISA